MSRLHKLAHTALVLLLAAITGCHPTQPFYLRDDGDLSHYLDKAMQVEHADVQEAPLSEARNSKSPITLTNPGFDELWDVTLQECVHIALQNTKVIRGGSTPRIQQGQIIAGTQEGSLTDVAGAFSTVYNPAIRESGVGGESGTGVEAALSQFDAQLRVLGSQGNNSIFNRSDRPRNTLSAFFPTNVQTDSGGMVSSLSKKAATGTTFTALNQTDYTRGNVQGTVQPLNSFWTTTMELRADQPLLRGRGEQVNRMAVVIARINTDTELANLDDQLQKMICNIEIRYWDLSNAFRTLETAKTGRDTTLTTWRTVYERFTSGVEPAQAEAQAREQYFAFRSAVEGSLRDLHNIENELRLLMGISASDGRLIRPIDEPTLARVDFDWNEILAEALVRRPELRLRRWELKRREMEMILARNQLLPRLDVGAFYRFVGIGDQLITAERRGINFPTAGSTAWDVLTDGDFQEFGFTGIFEAPVGFRRELAGVRNAQLNIAREKALLEDTELDISHSLVRGVRNLDSNYVLSQTHFNRWVAADREVKSALAVYEQGVGQGRQPLDLLLDATRRRATAQSAYYNAIAEYNKAIAFVHMQKGSNMEYNGISFEEGPWPHKAYWDALGRARQRDAGMYIDYGWTRPRVISQGPIDFGPTDAVNQGQSEDGRETLPQAQEATETPDAESRPGAIPNELGPTTMLPPPGMQRAGEVATSGKPTTEAFHWGQMGLTNAPQGIKTGGVSTASFNEESVSRRNESQTNPTHHPAAGTASGRTQP